jgi:hypothetical protein
VSALAVVYAGALAVGLVAYAAWCLQLYVTKEIAEAADLTTRIAFYTGRAVIWGGSLLLGGAVFGLAAAAVVKAIGGP